MFNSPTDVDVDVDVDVDFFLFVETVSRKSETDTMFRMRLRKSDSLCVVVVDSRWTRRLYQYLVSQAIVKQNANDVSFKGYFILPNQCNVQKVLQACASGSSADTIVINNEKRKW